MFVVSYVLIVAFHLHLNIKKIVVQRSCGHSINQLTTIDYLFDDQMKYVGVKLVKLLNDIAQEVSQQKKRAKMLSDKCFILSQHLSKKLCFIGLKRKPNLKI